MSMNEVPILDRETLERLLTLRERAMRPSETFHAGAQYEALVRQHRDSLLESACVLLGLVGGEEWLEDGARRLGDGLNALSQRHETDEHDGDPCLWERANVIAYLAHRIGLAPDEETLHLLVARMLSYGAHHQEHAEKNGHHEGHSHG